jgi:hypothetical protein
MFHIDGMKPKSSTPFLSLPCQFLPSIRFAVPIVSKPFADRGAFPCSRRLNSAIRMATLAVCLTVSSFVFAGEDNDLVVHEWGTFTSLQAADGQLLSWKALATADLPLFVYNWRKPGINRRVTSMFSEKGSLMALQRMETPVIYFYTAREQTANVLVKFPQGLVTEWYPRAQEIGPSVQTRSDQQVSANAALISMMPAFIAPDPTNQVRESLVRWDDVHLVPHGATMKLSALFPTNGANSHYYAARETDAALVRIDSTDASGGSQYEKFLFYRGVGNFETPLHVTASSAGAITLENTGKEKMSRLFVLTVRDGRASFVALTTLDPKQVQSRQLNDDLSPLPVIQARLAAEMEKALTSEGLFPREAKAMVNTWKDSWFAEEGLRVLYVLPRFWTDETLPLQVAPQPRETVRVMVGRAEIIVPGTERRLAAQILAARGDAQAEKELRDSFKRLGRFAEPVFYRALQHLNPADDEQARMVQLFQKSTRVN